MYQNQHQDQQRGKKRYIKLLILIAFLILIILIAFSWEQMKANASNTVYCYEEVEVTAGLTLWDIASDALPDNDDYKDIRVFIHDLMKINELDSALIYPGQRIIVPKRRDELR
ncbi:MAG: LysM peptidoglycan-binding domain-containing protein [Dethiobacteria bacterium]|jgi:hypothetical protein